MIDTQKLETIKETLTREKSRLEMSLSKIADRDSKDTSNWNPRYPAMSDEGVKQDDISDENADEVEEFDVILETEDALENRLRDVSKALKKIEHGSYGICEVCGKEIPAERLLANPEASCDIEHAK